MARFQAVYTPERQLAINETLIKFKGKVHFRQCIPIKPGRFGIKAFTLAESSSGYVLNSKIYTGKETNEVQRDLGTTQCKTISLKMKVEMALGS